jgi:hypothetical protein
MSFTHAPRVARTRRVLLVVPLLLGYAAGCGKDEPEPGYYLRGRVFNGASHEPVSKAELTLLSGQATHRATSQADGTYKLGPIEPSASYRVSAKANGMNPFEFTGLALPALEPAGERALIGDVALYESSEETPAFTIRVQSGDARVPATVARVDFTPVVVGTDPSIAATPARKDEPAPEETEEAEEAEAPPAMTSESTQSGTVIGAYVAAHGATLPSDAHADAVAFHVAVSDGVAEIPENALSWGATYQVRIDAGADFAPVTFMLTPVRDDDIQVVLKASHTRPPTQLAPGTQQYFTGRIYDGVSLARLTDYKVRLEYFDRVFEGTVDAMGRYVVGPLLTNADYTIVIEADGYRSFLSHNAKLPASAAASVSSLYYDAFVYPNELKAPAARVRFSLDSNGQLPSGSVRFAPRGGSSLFNEDVETPAGVSRQVWINDEDLQQRAVIRDFSDGQLNLAEGELVLGVDYAVSVFGVANYAILSNGTYRAGIDANPTFTLQPVNEVPLDVVSVSSDNAALSSNGSIEIRFNHDIVAFPRVDQAVAQRQLNDAFSIDSPDENEDGNVNALVDSTTLTDPIAPSYRGVTFEISGDRLTLKWDRERGLTTSDTSDPIVRVTYAGLSAIVLYTGTLPSSPSRTLAQLLGGTDSLEAQLVAE